MRDDVAQQGEVDVPTRGHGRAGRRRREHRVPRAAQQIGVDLARVAEPRRAVGDLQDGEGADIDDLFDRLDRGAIGRQVGAVRIRQVFLANREHGAQRIGDARVLPQVGGGQADLLAVAAADQRAAGSIAFEPRPVRGAGRDIGRRNLGRRAAAGLVRRIRPDRPDDGFLQVEPRETRVIGERRAVHEILEPRRRGMALRIAIAFQSADLADDRRVGRFGTEIAQRGSAGR